MWTVGPLSFAAPWALIALGTLPMLWWLLRVVPPAPHRLAFPAIRLLMGLETSQRTAARTPLWLVLLRFLLAVLVIASVAHPLLDAAPMATGGGPLLLAIDDGWAAAKQWPQRRVLIDNLLTQAERDRRPVILLPTAPPPDGGQVTASKLLPAGEARSIAQAIEPHPWAPDHAAARRALDAVPHGAPMRVVWLSDGLDDGAADGFAIQLRSYGRLEVARPAPLATAKIILPPRADAADLAPKIRRAVFSPAEQVSVRAADEAGRTLARETLDLPAGAEDAELRLPMPTELRNRVARLEIEGEGSAGAVALLDDRFKRRPVGLIDDQGDTAVPLLDDLFYVDRALSPFAELHRASVPDLLKRELSLAIMGDQGSLPADDQAALRHWVENGGVLVRLAGPKLAVSPDDLLPVRLRGGGGRVLGGAMSWTKPMALAPMPDSGPFAGLTVPPDLRVTAQVLAEPAIDLNDKTWARLEDGTPLVTGAPIGKGWLVLIHTTVWPAWSDLGLSGLFPQMMQRLLGLSQGVAGHVADRPLAPVDLLDGFGRLVSPAGAVEAIPANTQTVPLGPRHPPGLYGDESGRRALNLGPEIAKLRLLTTPTGASVIELGAQAKERDLQPPLLVAALLVLLADMLAVLGLRGLLRRRAATAMLAAVLFAGVAHPGHADSDLGLKAALDTRLAYVATGDGQIDDTSRAGLAGLSQVLMRRTTTLLGEPMAVDVEHDPLAMFPLLYWPVTGHQGALAPAARDRVNEFMRHGGMILFDTGDGGGGNSAALRQLTEGLDIPPLTAVTEAHVLTRSFYLLREMPGRSAGGAVYVQQGGDAASDNVSPVVIGGADWAAAWAVDRRGQFLYAAVPGGEQQREMAYRFGVNVVMYALTGSYKADQVHLPAIMERLKR
jgi:hypothetical protein